MTWARVLASGSFLAGYFTVQVSSSCDRMRASAVLRMGMLVWNNLNGHVERAQRTHTAEFF